MNTTKQFEEWWAEFEKQLDVFEKGLAKQIAWAAWAACGQSIMKLLKLPPLPPR